MAKSDKAKKNSRKSLSKKLAKQEKRALRAEADRARFQRSDRKTLAEASNKTAPVAAIAPRKPLGSADESGSVGKNSTVVSNSDPCSKSVINHQLAQQASILLAIAAGIGVLMGLVLAFVPGGETAIMATGGVLEANAQIADVPKTTAGLVLGLDTLFPVFFGGGLAVLVTSIQSRGNRPLVRLILTALLVAVLADFAENSLVYKLLTGEGESSFQWTATVIKYASIAFAGVTLATVLPITGALGHLAHIAIRYVFPIGIAVLLSGIGSDVLKHIVGASFPAILFILAFYAGQLSGEETASHE
ncbi:MAG: hypothetical protein QNJ29_09860 [Rhizobiaceae bacterium]|nr:hypothetical protein [Rhizobiaceae bacterium]